MRIRTIIIALQIVFGGAAAAVTTLASGDSQLQSAIQAAPLVFEPNHGQERAGVKFFSRAGNYSVSLMPGKAVLRPAGAEDQPVTIQFVGSNRSAKVEGADLLSSKTHYLTNPNPRKWHRNIPNYARAQYRNLYPGIDVVFYGDRRQVEYDFVLAPGANPNVLRLRVSGARVEIGANGDLLLATYLIRRVSPSQARGLSISGRPPHADCGSVCAGSWRYHVSYRAIRPQP